MGVAEAEDVPASDADSPHAIPAPGWRLVLRRVVRHAMDDRLMVLSAGISFFAVLSIAPVLVTAVSVYAAVNTPQQAMD
ncbi:MAG: rbn, partial [Blastococcus sp.]|nr:rbn [Blastococcus sp.]